MNRVVIYQLATHGILDMIGLLHIAKWLFTSRLQVLSIGDSGLRAVRVWVASYKIVRDYGHN